MLGLFTKPQLTRVPARLAAASSRFVCLRREREFCLDVAWLVGRGCCAVLRVGLGGCYEREACLVRFFILFVSFFFLLF